MATNKKKEPTKIVGSELEKSNRSKYGPTSDDLIARTYRDNHRDGDLWCEGNVKRYLGRFTRLGSSKAGNYNDLVKAADYLNRMIAANKHLKGVSKEIIE